jgi:hypothetical protein
MFRNFSGLFIVFGVVSLVCVALKDQLSKWTIDYRAVLVGNAILLVLSVVSVMLHARAFSKSNPNVFVRSVMLSNILKIMGIVAASVIYTISVGKSTAQNTIFAGLFLYVVYSWMEKKITMRLSKSRKG